MDSSCCSYITNGNFEDLFNVGIFNQGEVPNANWWNNYFDTIDGLWHCLQPSANSAYLPDLFSQTQGNNGWEVPVNNYSNGLGVMDPSLDGNYAAICIYDSPNSNWDDRIYLEQEL